MRKGSVKIILILLVQFFVIAVHGQESETQDLSYNLSSPYHALSTHLNNLEENNYQPQIAARPFMQEGVSLDDAQEMALKLKQVLNGAGIFVDLSEVPRNPDFLDSLLEDHVYKITERYPEIFLTREGSRWYYSEETINAIDELHNQIFPFGTEFLLDFLPKFGSRKIWGLHVWQHLAILIIILISFSVYKVLNFVFERLISQTLSRLGYKNIARKFILPIAKPFSILVVFLLIMFMVPIIQLPTEISRYVILGLRGIWPIFATAIFYHLVDILGIYLQNLANRTKSTLDDQLVPLIRKTLKAFVIVVGGMFILQNLDFDVTALLAGLSIGGLAFALAAQDTIKNFFGSLMIFIDKPFQIGDWITSGEIDGTVEEVGFRSTRVRTFRNSVTYVPNGKLADFVIDNHGLRQYRRFYTQITITYDTPPELIQLFVEGLRKIVEEHPETRKDYFNIYLNDLASYSLNVMFYIFFAVPTWPEELRCRHEIIIEIIKLADQLGVRFAFPTQTLHMENFPGQESLTPVFDKDVQEIRRQLNDQNKIND
ncbi:MAG: mechanosensitive ion channel family protein [Candidatus Cyclobacteriaceae bacterium M3_2C_046]